MSSLSKSIRKEVFEQFKLSLNDSKSWLEDNGHTPDVRPEIWLSISNLESRLGEASEIESLHNLQEILRSTCALGRNIGISNPSKTN